MSEQVLSLLQTSLAEECSRGQERHEHTVPLLRCIACKAATRRCRFHPQDLFGAAATARRLFRRRGGIPRAIAKRRAVERDRTRRDSARLQLWTRKKRKGSLAWTRPIGQHRFRPTVAREQTPTSIVFTGEKVAIIHSFVSSGKGTCWGAQWKLETTGGVWSGAKCSLPCQEY